MHRADFGVYGVMDQQIYRPKAVIRQRHLVVYARIGSPSDRNLVDVEIDSGIVFAGMIRGGRMTDLAQA